MIVYNAEPEDYSEKAELVWKKAGFKYISGSWNNVNKVFPWVTILIVRLGRVVNVKILNKFPDLEILISATTGLDHIDLNFVNKKGIHLVSLKGQESFLKKISSTAEHTFALLLSLIRKIPNAIQDVNDANWNRDRFKGNQLSTKSIGIIGLGRVGLMVANYAKCFGMEVYYVDPNINNEEFIKVNSLAELVSMTDVISVHVHLDKSTERLISRDLLKSSRDGQFLINTSRGDILDEKAVVDALVSGKLAGVAVDVLSTELDDIKNSELWKAKDDFQIIITPHIGGATYEAMWLCEEFVQGLTLNNQYQNLSELN